MLQVVNSEIIVEEIKPDLATKWLQFTDIKEKSLQGYNKAIRQFFKYLQVNNISKPTRQDIINYRDYLKSTCKATTTQAYISAVKLFFRYLQQENIYPDIAEHIKGAKIEKGHKKDYLTAENTKHFLQCIDRSTTQGKRDYAILSLMVTAGLRTIEVSRANIEDITTLAGNTILYLQGKGRDEKSEYVKIAKPVEDAIKDYLKTRNTKDKQAPLFISCSNHSTNNGRLPTESISRICKTHLRQAGYDSDRLTAHSLRHTTATLNLLQGGTLEETQQLLRHSNINTTLIYANALKRESNQSEIRIANAIFN